MLAVSGCSQWVMGDRQKVVSAAHEALCKENDFKAMRPFVSKNSLLVLDLTSAITNIGQVFLEAPCLIESPLNVMPVNSALWMRSKLAISASSYELKIQAVKKLSRR